MFSPGPMQLIIVLLIALLLFGNRLPSVMRSLGKSVVEFKKGVNDVDSQVKGALKDADDKAKNSDSSEE
ncbi:MAG: twin-arginine translocase TatA/TatE family subunit [Thermoguttaceae bacterium]|nr:twin-arginine translocase TatA/TatE family subunit [Thermoguttaceae bacterium]MBR5416256.1 twin-arginine translocase TatA/TatE family subunit [Thermoguttaceae bacterium]MBR6481531.1 twin-arginine translocase TatA/TatE family subunit [Thermoguttaceae bacterium]MCR5359506.1 twin-arginine translocase TatA/TatE family subunit [Thermoguttaceae bacterium]